MKYVVILVRSRINSAPAVRATLDRWQLHKRFHCRIFDEEITTKGMLEQAKDYITWGTCSDEQIMELFAPERFEKIRRSNDRIISCITRLHPPRKGFHDIHKVFSFTNLKGGLGFRGEHIIELLQRMLSTNIKSSSTSSEVSNQMSSGTS